MAAQHVEAVNYPTASCTCLIWVTLAQQILVKINTSRKGEAVATWSVLAIFAVTFPRDTCSSVFGTLPCHGPEYNLQWWDVLVSAANTVILLKNIFLSDLIFCLKRFPLSMNKYLTRVEGNEMKEWLFKSSEVLSTSCLQDAGMQN